MLLPAALRRLSVMPTCQDWYDAGLTLPWLCNVLGAFFCSFMNAWAGLRTRWNG